MPTLQYIIRCSKGRPTCVTITKCCCFDSMGRGVPASGAPVTVKLGDTTVASGSADSNGMFCFEPCTGGAYTLILGEQDNCVEGTMGWAIGECGAQPIATTQPGKPGYMCCNGIQVPTQLMFTDSNGSWPGSMLIGAGADATDVPHAGDSIVYQQKGWMDVTSSTPVPCLVPVGDTICDWNSPWYANVNEAVFTSNSGPLSYGYGITCGKDESGVYLELSAVWGFTLMNSNDYSYGTIACCFEGGLYHPYDCRIGENLGTVDYEGSPYGYCVPTPPQPNGPCKCHVWPGGGSYVANATVARVYLGDPDSCSVSSGPWNFTLEPGPTSPTGIVPTWQYESDVDCSSGGPLYNGPADFTIAPPPPGGPSVTVSGYFP